MSNESIPKYEVACELLEWAITTYISRRGYYAALHLAGAAEEVFAVYLKSPNRKKKMIPSSESFKDFFRYISEPSDEHEHEKLSNWVIDRMNRPRNSVKHKRGHKDEFVDFDAFEEAADVINRAINNYIQLQSEFSMRDIPSIGDFLQHEKIIKSEKNTPLAFVFTAYPAII